MFKLDNKSRTPPHGDKLSTDTAPKELWIVDVRIGMVAVYRVPMINCLANLVECAKIPYLKTAEQPELGLYIAIAHDVAKALNLQENQ